MVDVAGDRICIFGSSICPVASDELCIYIGNFDRFLSRVVYRSLVVRSCFNPSLIG